jgi:hypothetical protein
MAADRAGRDFLTRMARLVLVEVLVTQVEPVTALGAETLRVPVRINRATGGAATGPGRGRTGGQNPEQGEEGDGPDGGNTHGLSFVVF